MPDNVDFIQEQQAELLERQINAARVKHCGASALVCEECDAPIPAARRAAYPSAIPINTQETAAAQPGVLYDSTLSRNESQ